MTNRTEEKKWRRKLVDSKTHRVAATHCEQSNAPTELSSRGVVLSLSHSLSLCINTALTALSFQLKHAHAHKTRAHTHTHRAVPIVSNGVALASYLSRMSWLDVAVAPSCPSAALPTAAAAPLPASMILTHCNEPPARGAERVGGKGEGAGE